MCGGFLDKNEDVRKSDAALKKKKQQETKTGEVDEVSTNFSNAAACSRAPAIHEHYATQPAANLPKNLLVVRSSIRPHAAVHL